MEQSFGANFSSVRVHADSPTEEVGAIAYTQGNDIHFGAGQYDPEGARGKALLGHELAHVVQQSSGRVGATTQAKGVDLNDDSSFEREADAAGMQAARGEPVTAAGGGGSAADRAPVMQRAVGFEFETGWLCEKLPPKEKEKEKEKEPKKEARSKKERRPHKEKHKEKKEKAPRAEKEKAPREKEKDEEEDEPKEQLLEPIVDEDEPKEGVEKKSTAFAKKERVTTFGGAGFAIEGDEAGGGESELEFVTRPEIEETPEGAEQMDAVMANLVKAALTIRKGGDGGKPFTLDVATGQASDANTLIKPGDSEMKAGPQVTTGLKLEKVPEVLARKGGGKKLSGKPKKLDLKKYPNFNGFLMLIREYLENGRAKPGNGPLSYPKEIAQPLLARTDFAKLYQLVEDPVKQHYAKHDELWVKDVLKSVGFSELANENLIALGHVGGDVDDKYKWLNLDGDLRDAEKEEQKGSKGKDEKKKKDKGAEKDKDKPPSKAEGIRQKRDALATPVDLTVNDWLTGLIAEAAVDKLAKIPDHESMGELGNKTEKVGPDKQDAGIFEFRGDQGKKIGPDKWQQYASDWFRDIMKMHGHKEQPVPEKEKEKEEEGESDADEVSDF